MSDEKFEARYKDLQRNIELFPSKHELDAGVFLDEALRKRSLEEAEMEPSIWEDPERMRLFYTGTNPGMTVDNAFEKLDMLAGRLGEWKDQPSPASESGRIGLPSGLATIRIWAIRASMESSPQVWKDGAERLVKFESQLGRRLSSLTSRQFLACGTFSSSGYPPSKPLLRVFKLGERLPGSDSPQHRAHQWYVVAACSLPQTLLALRGS